VDRTRSTIDADRDSRQIGSGRAPFDSAQFGDDEDIEDEDNKGHC